MVTIKLTKATCAYCYHGSTVALMKERRDKEGNEVTWTRINARNRKINIFFQVISAGEILLNLSFFPFGDMGQKKTDISLLGLYVWINILI